MCLSALLPAPAQAAPPQVTHTSFSGITETAAVLEASVDPSGGTTKARFDYTPLAEFEAHGFEGATRAPAEDILVSSQVKGKGTLVAGSEFATGVETTAGAFAVGQAIASGTAIPPETTILAIEAEGGGETLRLKLSHSAAESVSPAALTATGPQPVSAALAGLSPGTGYVFRAVAHKIAGSEQQDVPGPPTTFYTYAPPPTFGACPNDALRSGALAPPGAPGALLPDCRSFELASPLDKNGNDVAAEEGFLRAAEDGSAVTFGSTFGLPGGVGAQALPFYQAARGADGWTTSGLLPPGSAGQEARFLVGQLPDLSATYAYAARLGEPTEAALFEIHRDGSPATEITPYADVGDSAYPYAFAGASADASSVLFESPLALPEAEGGPALPGARPGAPNVYAWERQSGHLHLASVMNTPAETEAKLAKGAYAGPYDWAEENLGSEGGPAGQYYVTDQHAVSADGSVFFTSRSSGHLYERLNPTAPQSALDSEGNCSEPAKACTLDVSATRRHQPDSAGEQPAAFQAATPDGSTAFFTSSEELTEDANTGPPQPPAQISRATLHGEEAAGEEIDSFIPAHALGIAVDPEGGYAYWADPSRGTIGRARLDASGDLVPGSVEAEFIVPGEGECPQIVKDAEIISGGIEVPPVFEEMPVPSEPRYVAVDEGHVYWTNTGRTDPDGKPIDGGGSIGRAALKPDHSGLEGEPEPDFICGAAPNKLNPNGRAQRLASNPQGIAVDSGHIYWANAASNQSDRRVARAATGGGEAEEDFVKPFASFTPYGLALDGSHLYFDINDELNGSSYIDRVSLEGEEEDAAGIGEAGLRGLAVDAGHIYWATRGEGGLIGRADLALNGESIETDFIDPEGTPEGLAASGGHLLWSVNGESPKNPGNDLYRYRRGAAEPLTDLTPDSADPDGAEVLGVLGASEDGSDVYFAANAVLDQRREAEPGDCSLGRSIEGGGSIVRGECNIYLSHEGRIEFVARVKPITGGEGGGETDAADWLPRMRLGGFNLQKSSLVSAGGGTLVFRSRLPLTATDNQGVPEYYRYRRGEGIDCLTCGPTGTPGGGEAFGSLAFFSISPDDSALGAAQVRFASADGNRFFFETAEPMVGYDTDGRGGCPPVGRSSPRPSCLDVYEWEAPGTGSCSEGGPGYSPVNGGCVYLISQDSNSGPSFFAGASASGSDVFFITSSRLVGEDTDELRDVYDARVEGGLASQNRHAAPPCEAEGCRPAATPPPGFQAPPQFSGPADPKPRHCHGKRCHRKRQHRKRRHRKRHHRPGHHKEKQHRRHRATRTWGA